MGLTDGLTFILFNLHRAHYLELLISPDDPADGQIVRRHLNFYLITGQDFDKIHSQLAGNMRQNRVSIADIDLEHRVRQCIGDDALKFDYVVFCQVINLLGFESGGFGG